MHRDCQHRNIMTRNGEWYFIDFQSGRIGPVTYDLASLLIDPYVDTQKKQAPDLIEFAFEIYAKQVSVSRNVFVSSYRACALTRNLQILGAYAFLSRIKNKPEFEKYIPPALQTLQKNLSEYQDLALPKLSHIVNAIQL
jgi:aminoglycoside/choline kinase family phosphotransferase